MSDEDIVMEVAKYLTPSSNTDWWYCDCGLMFSYVLHHERKYVCIGDKTALVGCLKYRLGYLFPKEGENKFRS